MQFTVSKIFGIGVHYALASSIEPLRQRKNMYLYELIEKEEMVTKECNRCYISLKRDIYD